MIFGFTKMQCGECGIEFCVPDNFYEERRQRRLNWHCPNGHVRAFCETDADVLRRERDRLKQQIAERDDEVARQREYRAAAERRASAARGQLTKLKKRAANGVCPCCNRTFTNLQRHMASKHPGFVSESPTGDEATIQ